MTSITNIDFVNNQLILAAEMPLQDFISVWFLDENNSVLSRYHTGDRLPYSTRPIKSRFFSFPIPQEEIDYIKIVIRFDTHDGMFEPGPLFIERLEQFNSEMQFQNLIYGFLYGGMFILGMYNLLLFISHRDKKFLLYFLFITSYFLYNASLRGFAAQYLFPDWPTFINQFKIISLSFCYFFLYLFVTNMLATKANYPRSHLVYTIIVSSLSIPFFLAIGDHYAWYYRLAAPPAILMLLGVIYFSLRGAIRGDRTSKILLAAWIVLASGGILYSFGILGVIEPNLFVFYSVDVGSTIESLLLAFALGDQLNQMRQEKELSDALLISNQRANYQELEQKVEERTHQLRIAKEHAESANQAKNLFLSNVSHEVRTPMNGVLSMLKVLRRSNLTEQQLDYLNMVERSGNRMVAILNDLLEYSHLEEGIKPETNPISIKLLVNGVIETFSELAHKKELLLETQLPEEIPIVCGDYKLLQQLLSNLISNAIKYTHEGKVSVSLMPVSIEKSSVFLEFSVCDTGIGISLSLQDQIFDRFHQIDDSYSRGQDGMGLGLAICKQIATVLKARLDVKSVPEKGSEFIFSLSLPLANKDILVSLPKDALGISNNLRILLVEDEPISRFAANHLLQEDGHIIKQADNGFNALSALEDDNAYDVILMDVHMPGMDGLEATRRIRSHYDEKLRKICIVGLTASVTSQEKSEYIEAGMGAVVTKPLELSELGEAINKLLFNPGSESH